MQNCISFSLFITKNKKNMNFGQFLLAFHILLWYHYSVMAVLMYKVVDTPGRVVSNLQWISGVYTEHVYTRYRRREETR